MVYYGFMSTIPRKLNSNGNEKFVHRAAAISRLWSQHPISFFLSRTIIGVFTFRVDWCCSFQDHSTCPIAQKRSLVSSPRSCLIGTFAHRAPCFDPTLPTADSSRVRNKSLRYLSLQVVGSVIVNPKCSADSNR